MVQKHFLYCCKCCNSPPAGPHRVLFLFPARYEQTPSERATKRSTERPIDRAIQRLFFQTVFHLAKQPGHPYNYQMQRASNAAIEQVISYRPLPLDGLVGYREANRIFQGETAPFHHTLHFDVRHDDITARRMHMHDEIQKDELFCLCQLR